MSKYYYFTPERMNEEFKSLVNWKLYNNILYLLTEAEDKGNFLIDYEIMINDTVDGNYWSIYNSKEGWCALEMYDGIGKNSKVYFEVEILDKKRDEKCSQYLNYIREKLLEKYPNLKLSENMYCAYYVSYGNKTGYGGFSMTIMEK